MMSLINEIFYVMKCDKHEQVFNKHLGHGNEVGL
jgi:hypothetical protein